jgi:uncharacterized protein YacL
MNNFMKQFLPPCFAALLLMSPSYGQDTQDTQASSRAPQAGTTVLLGIIGSVVGGLLARLFSRPVEGSSFHPAGFILSIVGAILVVLLVRVAGG